ncbi:2-arachidonoylglycerol hydrolase ABHD12 [Caerostris extrusa]|uniref:2-arachidonoylglycerol hydrolase ABHD12 n=1 Tax=Caerostris extrusa TaxID=172846 RepID=A0AAV4XND4_CAEEX|nr:2-arachidonoylglycerol hydrolase ABHD12 [Caerostris extrusa]
MRETITRHGIVQCNDRKKWEEKKLESKPGSIDNDVNGRLRAYLSDLSVATGWVWHVPLVAVAGLVCPPTPGLWCCTCTAAQSPGAPPTGEACTKCCRANLCELTSSLSTTGIWRLHLGLANSQHLGRGRCCDVQLAPEASPHLTNRGVGPFHGLRYRRPLGQAPWCIPGSRPEAPFTSIADATRTFPLSFFHRRLPLFEAFCSERTRHPDTNLDTLDIIGDIQDPLLILHAADDSMVWSEQGRRLWERAVQVRSPHLHRPVFVEFNRKFKCGHRDIHKVPHLSATVADFLQSIEEHKKREMCGE